MSIRTRIIAEPPPRFPPPPGWARPNDIPNNAVDAVFAAGAALAALHPLARDAHPLGALWRQRLALHGAAALVHQGGRAEGEAALRDAWYLRRDADDPGPAGQVLGAWRRLGTRHALASDSWATTLPALLMLRDDDALQQAIAAAISHCKGEGNPVHAAASVAANSLRLRPDCRPLALWLADAVLAHRLNWPAPVPLLAAHIPGGALRHASASGGGDHAWLHDCSAAYTRAAAAACDLYAELTRRADKLLATAPTLRSKDADTVVATLLREDAQPARAGQAASERSSRRLFERLVALGAVRELTGRTTFRLYGL